MNNEKKVQVGKDQENQKQEKIRKDQEHCVEKTKNIFFNEQTILGNLTQVYVVRRKILARRHIMKLTFSSVMIICCYFYQHIKMKLNFSI